MKQLTVNAIAIIPITLTVPDDYEITIETPDDIDPIMGEDSEVYELVDQVDIALRDTSLCYEDVVLVNRKEDVKGYLEECLTDDIEPCFEPEDD